MCVQAHSMLGADQTRVLAQTKGDARSICAKTLYPLHHIHTREFRHPQMGQIGPTRMLCPAPYTAVVFHCPHTPLT